MSTDYLVKCPQMNCHWFGSLPASPDVDDRRGASTNVSMVALHCPQCHQIWRARLIGDDLETLRLEPEDDLALSWPQVDLGVGD